MVVVGDREDVAGEFAVELERKLRLGTNVNLVVRAFAVLKVSRYSLT